MKLFFYQGLYFFTHDIQFLRIDIFRRDYNRKCCYNKYNSDEIFHIRNDSFCK